MRQVPAIDEIHADEFRVPGKTEVKNTNNVLMSDFAGENQLLLEALQDVLIARKFGANDLQRHHAIEFPVACIIHRAHAALAQQGYDLVSAAQAAARLRVLEYAPFAVARRSMEITPARRVP